VAAVSAEGLARVASVVTRDVSNTSWSDEFPQPNAKEAQKSQRDLP